MAASRTRNEYYWMNRRLVVKPSRRSGINRPFRLRGSETCFEHLSRIKGTQSRAAANPLLLAQAMLRERRLAADPSVNDIGRGIPQELLRKTSEIVELAVDGVTGQSSQLGSEERKTGALSYAINCNMSGIELGGWQLSVFLQGFSSQTKEPIIGADFGIIVDVRNEGIQVSKGLWAQAKAVNAAVQSPLTLQNLKSQLGTMLERTDDAYGVIYSPDGIRVFQGHDAAIVLTVSELITDTAWCKRGDRRPEFLADTVDRDFLIEIAFEKVGSNPSGTTLIT